MIAIRPAVPDDAEALTHLHLDTWDETYSGLIPQAVLDERRRSLPDLIDRRQRALAKAERGGPFRTWVAVSVDERLVGFVVAGTDDDAPADGPREKLFALYVRAAHYGTGLGRRLLLTALDDRPAYLWVLAGNERAIRFYEREGFRADGQQQVDEVGTELRMVRTRGGPDQPADLMQPIG